ncbi:MAG: beta-N-acetylglucosaminidase domain-containing protein [Pseudomonadales bacterium]
MPLHALPFGLGLIEGFYGRGWEERDRRDCIEFLAKSGYHYYVYAPKGDPCLRKNWRGRWAADAERLMHDISAQCARQQLLWGTGLSPLGLVENPTPGNRQSLRDKVRYLDGFGTQILCILFEDMPRGVDSLGELQCELVQEVLSVTSTPHVLVCPSYYSADPILEKLFGSMPPRYWETLGSTLPLEVGLFWTGEQVCSRSYDEESLRRIAGSFGRLPVLWDNYPVNDGAKASRLLHLDAFRNRPASLAQLSTAHFVNPMNQCWLSRIPLATLPRLYRDGPRYEPDVAFRRAADELCGREMGALLAEDLGFFQTAGLASLTPDLRRMLVDRYGRHDSPYARELLDWLANGYAFDPACLTD